MKKIFAWSASQDGCSWYRLELPLAEYAKRGGDVHINMLMPEWVRDEADIIIGQRVAEEGASNMWQKLCKAGRATMVYEIDDDLFHIDPSNISPYEVFKDPTRQENIRRNAAAADVVTVTTEPLAELFRQYNPNVVVVPNRIPEWLLAHKRPQPDHLTVGWAGSASHSMDFSDAGPQIARFLNRNPYVHYHAIGALFGYGKALHRDRVRTTRWIGSVDDYYRAIDFDVALGPLRPHTFNQSKSALRPLEMAALGIPIVASAVGPYEDFVMHGVTGYLVHRDHEWGKYLYQLVRDDEMRAAMSQQARNLASWHTVEGNLASWTDAWGIPALDAEVAA